MIQNFTGNVPSKKISKTCACFCKIRTGGQFLNDRARSTINGFRILLGVPEQRNVEKTLNNICKTRTGGQFFAKSRDLVITVKLAEFLTDRVWSGINRFRILLGMSRAKQF